MRRFNPDTLSPPDGPYARIVYAGDFAFLAGQVAIDLQGRVIGGDDHEAQAVQCFTNLRTTLEAMEVGPERIVRLTFYVAREAPPGLVNKRNARR